MPSALVLVLPWALSHVPTLVLSIASLSPHQPEQSKQPSIPSPHIIIITTHYHSLSLFTQYFFFPIYIH